MANEIVRESVAGVWTTKVGTGGGAAATPDLAAVLAEGADAGGVGIENLGLTSIEAPEDAIALQVTGFEDQGDPILRVTDSAGDADHLFEVNGYQSGNFVIMRDFFRHAYFEVESDGDGHVNQITIDSRLGGTTLTSAAADTECIIGHDTVTLGNGTTGTAVIKLSTDIVKGDQGTWIRVWRVSAPADGDLVAGSFGLWLDDDDVAPALNIKAKTADGTLASGTIPLTPA